MINNYKDWLIINGSSNTTIINYISRIKKFLRNVKLEDIKEENVNKFLLELKQKYSPSTVNGYKETLKSFFKFLKKDIPLPKSERINRTIPETISEEFFKEKVIPIVECIFNNPMKVKAIFYFMFYTGIRVGELNLLKRTDINLEKQTANITYRKNKQPLIVFFNKEVKATIENYFSAEEEYVNAFNSKTKCIQKMFEKVKTHITEVNFHPHLFRHSFAVMALMKGADISKVQQLLGHKNIATTERYVQLNTEQLQQVYNKLFN